MAYPITTTAGATLATIADGTVNSTATSLTLIGKNYAGYGNFLNENYVKLLENFSNSTAPAHAIRGQLWYDSSVLTLKVYDGTLWKPISSSASSTTAPTSPVTGDLWWDSTNLQLKVWSGSAWITIGPTYTATTGTSGPIVETILDSSGGSHIVTKFYIADIVMAILSKDSTFTPQTSINGFTQIVPGFNLISSSALTGSQFTGDVSNALTLQGVNASQFLRSDQNTSTAYTVQAANVQIGSDLNISPNFATNEVQLTNSVNGRDFGIYVNSANVKTRVIGITGSTAAITFGNSTVTIGGTLTVEGAVLANAATTLNGLTTLKNSLVPNTAFIGNIGAPATPFANVYAANFIGNTVASYMTIGGNLVPNLSNVISYVQTTGQNSQGVKYVNADIPSGGNNGDIWYRI
jgi:hypothetical protein